MGSVNARQRDLSKHQYKTQQLRADSQGYFQSFVRGTVINNEDKLNLGRIQVRIPTLDGIQPRSSDYKPDNELPWASPGIWNSTSNDSGAWMVPPVGATVFVNFENGETDKRIFFGGIPSLMGQTEKALGQFKVNTDDLPTESGNIIHKTIKGSALIMNDEDGKEEVVMIDSNGQHISMKSKSQVKVRRGNKRNNNLDNGEIIITGGDIKLKTKDKELSVNEIATTEEVWDTVNDSIYALLPNVGTISTGAIGSTAKFWKRTINRFDRNETAEYIIEWTPTSSNQSINIGSAPLGRYAITAVYNDNTFQSSGWLTLSTDFTTRGFWLNASNNGLNYLGVETSMPIPVLNSTNQNIPPTDLTITYNGLAFSFTGGTNIDVKQGYKSNKTLTGGVGYTIRITKIS